MKRRSILYLSGTRADFGLLQSTLKLIHQSSELEVEVAATGMHLQPAFGMTISEIEASGLPIRCRIPIDIENDSDVVMGRNIGRLIELFINELQKAPPDILLLLGDRGEMLAGAIAATHLSIPIVHIHGGERSGTIDERVRHSISKLAQYHCVATHQSRKRLIRMGERPESIFVTGAPGLDEMIKSKKNALNTLSDLPFDSDKPFAIFLLHPEAEAFDKDFIRGQIDALLTEGLLVISIGPNSDEGNAMIRSILQEYSSHDSFKFFDNIPRLTFIGLMAKACLMAGNSSSGIIEAATFGLPVINVGSRQNYRERNTNVVDIFYDLSLFRTSIKQLINHKENIKYLNRYGNGTAGSKIYSCLKSIDISNRALEKINAY